MIDRQTQEELTPLPIGMNPGHTFGGVYFIAGAGFVKIGRSVDVRTRYIYVNSASPVRLRALGYIPCDHAAAKQLEKELHDRFISAWSHCEWFHQTPELTKFIETQTQRWPGHLGTR